MRAAVVESARSRYLVRELLSEGGMGAIYLARRQDADSPDGGPSAHGERDVVLKALLPELTSEPALVELFLREARLTAQLDHPHIVRTLDLALGQGTYMIVMEYVRGADLRTLSRRARRRGHALSPRLAVHWARQILTALDYAHRRLAQDGRPLGLIHRDLSPSNILLDGDGVARLSDFGIAKQAAFHSRFRNIQGKVGYLSPEQALGEPLDQRSDLFSLGVCIHEGLVGERLYPHAATSPSAAAVFAVRPPAPSLRRPELPRELDEWMARALAHDRAARFATAAEMLAGLERIVEAHRLALSNAKAALQLKEACGADPRRWLFTEGAGRRAPPAVQDGIESPDEGATVIGPGPTREPAPTPERPLLAEGTQVTSVLAPAPRRGGPDLHGSDDDEVTAIVEGGEATQIRAPEPRVGVPPSAPRHIAPPIAPPIALAIAPAMAPPVALARPAAPPPSDSLGGDDSARASEVTAPSGRRPKVDADPRVIFAAGVLAGLALAALVWFAAVVLAAHS